MEEPSRPRGVIQLAYEIGDLKLTYGFLLVFAAIFGAELYISRSYSQPDLLHLMLLGASNAKLVLDHHEWHRLWTAGLLHGGWLHLLFNGYAMYFAGSALEPLIGRSWFFLVFWIGVVGGSVAGLYVNSPQVLSVGASGGIMALLAAMFVVAHRIPAGPQRDFLRVQSLQVLVPSLIPIGLSIGGGKVDYGAHAGGAVTGGLLGLVLLAVWPVDRLRPRFGRATTVLALLVTGVVVWGVMQIVRPLPGFLREATLSTQLAPIAEVQATFESKHPDLTGLLAKYPRDPALHYYQGLLLLEGPKPDRAKAIEEFNRGLGETEILSTFYAGTELEAKLRSALSKAQTKNKR